jgi:Zn-dependent protease
MENIILTVFFRFPDILIALTVHEMAHGWVARKLGDDTAERMGRLSFNPLAHLDLFGTIMLLFGPFGWAKPVPVNPMKLGNPKRDMVWVALAGPLSNILLGYLVALIYRSLFMGIGGYGEMLFFYLILINIGLSFFNLLPIPPLDGSNIVRGFLSRQADYRFMMSMRFVPMIFLMMIGMEWLLHIPVLSFILDPLWKPYLKGMLDLYELQGLMGR